MIVDDEEARVRELLAPLRRIEPVPLKERPSMRHPRPIAIALAAVAALAIVGVAIAAGIGAFSGIGSAQHGQRPQDVIDRSTAASLKRSPAGFLFSTSRLVGRLPSGRRIWVVTDTRGDLCEVVERAMAACGGSLSATQPITISSFRRGPHEPPVSFGVARDGVTAVSFRAHGHEVTVPVNHNVWAYEGTSNVLRSAIVHYASGTTTTLNH